MILEALVIAFLIQVPSHSAEQEAAMEDRTSRLERPPIRRELDEFTNLLPVEGLDGWTTVGGRAQFVREGDLLRGLDSGSRNTFLMSDRVFGDFILEGEVMIESGNSGWQIRSHLAQAGDLKSRLRGYQIEVDPSARGWSGGLYDEGRRGWIHPMTAETDAPSPFNRAGWNHYRIEAIGPRIRAWVNGTACADVVDLADLSGSIALQVHSGDCRVQWRNLVITELGQSRYTDRRSWEKCSRTESSEGTVHDPVKLENIALSGGEDAQVRSLHVHEGLSVRIPYQASDETVLKITLTAEGRPDVAVSIGDSETVLKSAKKSRLPVLAPGAGMTELGDEWRELFLDLESSRLVLVDEGLLQSRMEGVLENCSNPIDLRISCVRGELLLGQPMVLERIQTENGGNESKAP
ncbi:MAG: hypothetical protein CBC35_10260 [Planctomycetes bacterium TMED75]|nr:MAG: hypothetical protein CBC35_10260 [Planctomycetes bacterium TMED75]